MRRSRSSSNGGTLDSTWASIIPAQQQQQMRSSLETASSVASSLAMLSLTGAARPIMGSPIQVVHSPAGVQHAAAAAAAAGDGRLVPAAGCLRFPEVSIVFAAVEGAAQLAGHPALARWACKITRVAYV
jgi:hypothetical protein